MASYYLSNNSSPVPKSKFLFAWELQNSLVFAGCTSEDLESAFHASFWFELK
jgi:hypothetical protein